MCYIEAIKTIIGAYQGRSFLAPKNHCCSVCAVAKKDLTADTTLDGIGGTTTYGSISTNDIARVHNLLPIGLTQGTLLAKDVKKDEFLTWDMIESRSNFLFGLHKQQSAMENL